MPIERKLAAIMFTDIAGYTALSAKDSTKASKLLTTQRDILKPIVEKHGGSWMKEIGDGLLLTFDSATSAVECSIAIQESTKDIEDLNLRIAIHQGEVIKQDGDVIGDDVNVTSRIEPFSAIGGVAISDKVYRDISSNQEFETKYIGKPKLKGVAQKVEVYCITSHGLPQTDISKVSAKLEQESKFNIFALTGGILTAIGIAFWIAVGVFDVSFGGKAEVPSVGILMMKNLGKENEEFWSSGMTADLITKVAGAGLIRVAPLDDILKLDKDLSIEEKAKKLRVKYILTHSFLINADGFDLWCKLENIENGVALFSNKISEPMDMTTQMVGKLASDIVTSLKVQTKQDMMKAATTNAEAYEYMLRAKYMYIYEKRENLKDTEIARGLLRKAIELDDNLIVAKELLGWTYYKTGDSDKAMKIYTPALKQAEEIGDKVGMGYVLNAIGAVYNKKDDNNTALDYFERSFKIREELGDKRGMGVCLSNIGNIHNEKGDDNTALDYYERSFKITEEIDDKGMMGWNLHNIRSIYDNNGDYDNALDYFHRELKIQEELDEKDKVLRILHRIGGIYYVIGEYRKALDNYNRLLIIDEELDDKYSIQNDFANMGLVYFQQEVYNKAVEYLDKSATMQMELDSTITLETLSHLFLSKKILGKEYNVSEIHTLIKEEDEIEDYINFALFKLLEDPSYLETAYNQIQEKGDTMEDKFKAKFLSYPIPKAIVEEWEKVK